MSSADDLNQHNVVIPTKNIKTEEEKDDDTLDGADVVDIDKAHEETYGDTNNETISKEINADEEAIEKGPLDEELEEELPSKSSTG